MCLQLTFKNECQLANCSINKHLFETFTLIWHRLNNGSASFFTLVLIDCEKIEFKILYISEYLYEMKRF